MSGSFMRFAFGSVFALTAWHSMHCMAQEQKTNPIGTTQNASVNLPQASSSGGKSLASGACVAEPLVEFSKGIVSKGKSTKSIASATLKVVGGTPQLFLRDDNKGEYVKPSHRLRGSSSGRGSLVGMSVQTWSFSPGGKLIAIGWGGTSPNIKLPPNNEGAIEVWEVSTGRLVKELSRPFKIGSVAALAFSEDGRQIFYDAASWYVDGL